MSIDIVVQSKYPKILKQFKEGFWSTTESYLINLHVLDGEEFGAKAINKILQPILKTKVNQIFGVFNDDIWFVQGWLENVIYKLQMYDVVSPGYVETQKVEVFQKAVEATKSETDVVQHLYGPTALFHTRVFFEIGIFDEQFDWSCDDLDLAWRLKLRGLKSVTSKKITTAHQVGMSRGINSKVWNALSEKNKQRFYDKHGYRSYRDIRSEYKKEHQYFIKFR